MKILKKKAEKVRQWYSRTAQPVLIRAWWKVELYARHAAGKLGRFWCAVWRRPSSWVPVRAIIVAAVIFGGLGFLASLAQSGSQASTTLEGAVLKTQLPKREPAQVAIAPALPEPAKLQGTVAEMPRPPVVTLPANTSAYAPLPTPRPTIQVRKEAGEQMPLARRRAEKPESGKGSRFMTLPVTGERVEFYPSRRNRAQVRQTSEKEEIREVSPRRKYQRLRRAPRLVESNPYAERDAMLASRNGGNN